LREQLLDGLTSPRFDIARLARSWDDYCKQPGKDNTAEQRLRASLVIRFLVEAVQRALRLSLGADVPGLETAERARLRALADRLGPDRLLEVADRCVEADFHVERK